MKKLNKLFAILFAVLEMTTLKAQTDVTDQYLTNAGFDDETSFVNNGVCTYAKDCSANGTTLSQMQPVNGWTFGVANGDARASGAYAWDAKHFLGGKGYTIPSTDEEGNIAGGALGICAVWDAVLYYYQEVTLKPGVYEFSYCVYNSGNGANAVNKNLFGFVADNGTSYYGATKTFTSNSWTKETISFTLATETKGKISVGIDAANAGSGNSHHLFVDYIKLIRKSFDDVSAENPADFTSLIKNPSFETGNLDGWTYIGSSDTGVKPNSNNTYKTSGVDGNYLYNTWWQGTPLTQTVGNIPNGIYELKVLLASDQNAKLFLLANDEHSEVYTITTDNKTFHDVSYEFKVLNGQAKIGVVGGNDAGEYVPAGHWWYKADNFRLIYKGADISIEKEALEANIATARAIDQATIPTAIATQLTAAITAAENVEQTLNAIKAATNELIEIINLANELKEPYGDAKTLIAECEAMSTNSTASDTDKATYQSAINKAKANLEEANAKAAIDDIMATLHNAQKAYCLVAAPTEGHPFDMTWLVVNPNFDVNTDGWAYNTNAGNHGRATNQGGAITGGFFENWDWNSYKGEIFQELTGLPKGKYVLTAAAFRDQLIDGAADADAVYVFANDESTLVNSPTPAFYSVEVSTTDGKLRFGVQSKDKVYRWMGIDNVTLKYVAGLDLSEFTAAYTAALEAAEAARDNEEYNKVGGAEKAALLAAIAATPEQTQEALSNARDALVAATATFTAAKGDYDKLVEEKKIAADLGMSNDLINPDAANTKTGLQALQDLKVAEYTYIYSTYTESATLGSWTENFAEDLNGEGYKPDGEKYLNEWGNATRTAKQTVKLPAGDYAISSIGRGQVGTSGYLYYKIGDKTTQVDFIMKGNRGRGVDVDGVANFSDGGTYNCNGEGFGWEYRFITFHLDAETEVEIGVSATFANAWVSIYAPVLLTTEASVKALRLSEIATALGNVPTGKMDATVQAELDDAVAAAENVTSASTIDELNSVSTALTEAIAKAKTSVADYAAIKTYIDKADKIDASIAAGYKSQYGNGNITETATNVFQTLEVATYNYVTGEFKYPVALSGDWTTSGPVGELSDQHWSGEKRPYMEQSSAAWGWDAWSISYEQDLTLPAGEYVFKVAGRKAAGDGCTLELIVTKGDETLGTVNDFPEGDTGLGINKNGVTSFDANDEAGFANNNAGRAWQWRYVKFTLGEAATVNIAVKAEATTNHQWISFCDATVQMTEETYLEANKGGLDAPTAAAEALVDTKPMGTLKNEALQAALDMPVTTGAELLAKIEALNTAVANANAWVVEYNNAKVQLVEALERFEADYNDAENGAIDHMNKDRWATAISMAQAAAEAKDVTNSYDGFATAAENLVDALDAATTSIDEYAALNEAINNATPIVEGGNWGDQPFQMPLSVKEQLNVEDVKAQYDAAEIDGEEVTTLAETLNQGIEGIVLNAPAVDARYAIQTVANWIDFTRDNKDWDHLQDTYFTYIANDRKDQGKYNIKIGFAKKDYYAQAFGFEAVEDVLNGYKLYQIDKDGNTRYISTGVPHGGNAAQIRTTTEVEKALVLQIVPTTTDGVFNLYNTENKSNLSPQDEGVYCSGYDMDDVKFVAASKAEVTLSISAAGWATLILPFNAEKPEGVVAYESDGVKNDAVQLVEATSLVANTPYLIKSTIEIQADEKREFKFSGYGLADKDSYSKGLFVGTYVEIVPPVEDSYVLQKKNGVVAFYQVDPNLNVETTKLRVGAYRSYMKYTPAEGQAASPMFRIGGSTGIDNATLPNSNEVVIYDLMGRKVTTMEKGNMYIINGRKVIVK